MAQYLLNNKGVVGKLFWQQRFYIVKSESLSIISRPNRTELECLMLSLNYVIIAIKIDINIKLDFRINFIIIDFEMLIGHNFFPFIL